MSFKDFRRRYEDMVRRHQRLENTTSAGCGHKPLKLVDATLDDVEVCKVIVSYVAPLLPNDKQQPQNVGPPAQVGTKSVFMRQPFEDALFLLRANVHRAFVVIQALCRFRLALKTASKLCLVKLRKVLAAQDVNAAAATLQRLKRMKVVVVREFEQCLDALKAQSELEAVATGELEAVLSWARDWIPCQTATAGLETMVGKANSRVKSALEWGSAKPLSMTLAKIDVKITNADRRSLVDLQVATNKAQELYESQAQIVRLRPPMIEMWWGAATLVCFLPAFLLLSV